MESEADICPTCNNRLSKDTPLGLCPVCLVQGCFVPDDSGTDLSIELRENQPSGQSGTSFQAPTVEELNALLPQFSISETIGRGGMGAVYKGRQNRLKRNVAIKVLPANFGTDMQFAARFEREAQSMAALQHPNIVSVFDFGEVTQENGVELLYFVMEYVGWKSEISGFLTIQTSTVQKYAYPICAKY